MKQGPRMFIQCPYAIDDTIYFANRLRPTMRVEAYVVTAIRVYKDEISHHINTQIECYSKDRSCTKRTFDECDRYDVFLNKADAEKRLKE